MDASVTLPDWLWEVPYVGEAYPGAVPRSAMRDGANCQLVLFSEDQESYGAHVGVVVADNQVLHLCKEVGKPVVWTMEEFASRPRYAVTLGYKRVRRA